MNLFQKIFVRLRSYVVKRLIEEVDDYEQRIYNNFTHLHKYIRKGDLLLVEGRSRVSQVIKLFSQSHWSHIAMYVGDELIRSGQPDRDHYLELYGKQAKRMLVEAYPGQGVTVAPLEKYRYYNIRLCRAYGIRRDDLRTVVRQVISNIGKHYDQQNIIDIALMLLPGWLNPFRKRNIQACLGSCNQYQVICSGMIAQAFQMVGYPVNPVLSPDADTPVSTPENPYGATLVRRHYSQMLPRDFDLSPNFEIIKFNIIKGGRFHYKSLPWGEELISNLDIQEPRL